MSGFVDKASSKISKLSTDEICRIIQSQNDEINIKNTILDSFGEGILLVDNDFRISYYNKFFVLVGSVKSIKRNSYNGLSVEKTISDLRIVSFIKECVAKHINDGELTYDIDTSMYGKMQIRITSTAIRSIDCVLFRFTDVTFMAKLREEFKKNESLAAMTTMAAQVAHEIKNPLASISIYIQLLEKKMEKNGSLTSEDAKPALNVISEEIERLNQIAVDFLFAVKPMKVNPEIADINDVVRKTISVIKPELDSNNISLKLDLATSLPKLRIDTALVQQSILNLVKNALQAISVTDKKGIINIHSFVEENCVKVSVNDNGCGITEEQMSKLFEPYYTTKSNGTGLGLTTIFKIMKELGGEITVSSVNGDGAVFTMQFPIPDSERYKIQRN